MHVRRSRIIISAVVLTIISACADAPLPLEPAAPQFSEKLEVIISPIDEIGKKGCNPEALPSQLAWLAEEEILSPGEAKSLSVVIETAMAQYDRGNDGSADQILVTFIRRVETLVRRGRLDGKTHSNLIQHAEQLRGFCAGSTSK